METISKHIGEGFSKGELYAALAYDSGDAFGGMAIKQLRFNPVAGAVAIRIGTNANPRTETASGVYAIELRTQYNKIDGYGINMYVKAQYIYDGAGTGNIHSIIAHAEVEGTLTSTSTASYIESILGRAQVTGTVYNGSLFVTGIHAQILDGGTYTSVSHVCALWADYQLKKTVVAGSSEILYLTNNSASTEMVDQAMYIYAPYVTNFFRLDGATVGSMVGADIGATAVHKTICRPIKIDIDGVTFYLLASTTYGTS